MPFSSKINEIHKFWFGDIELSSNYSTKQGSLWFGKDDKIDDKIRSRFLLSMEILANTEHPQWIKTDKGLISAVVLLDQFTRNAYRGTSKMYQHDDLALSISKSAVDTGRDSQFNVFERVFLYLPYEHSEDIKDQEICIRLFEKMLNEQNDEMKKVVEGYLLFAQKHYEVIHQFGRFPHRNKLLGRDSTSEERAYLSAGGGF